MGLDRVAIDRRSVESTTACIQSFVRARGFTERDFSIDNGIGMLSSAVTAAATVCEESSYEPWANVMPEGYEAFVFHLEKAHDVVVVRRKNAHDTLERWFVVRSVESLVVGQPTS